MILTNCYQLFMSIGTVMNYLFLLEPTELYVIFDFFMKCIVVKVHFNN